MYLESPKQQQQQPPLQSTQQSPSHSCSESARQELRPKTPPPNSPPALMQTKPWGAHDKPDVRVERDLTPRASSTPKSRGAAGPKPAVLPWNVSAESKGLTTTLQLEKQHPLVEKTAVYYQGPNRDRSASAGRSVWMQQQSFQHRRIPPSSAAAANNATVSFFGADGSMPSADAFGGTGVASTSDLADLPMQAFSGLSSGLLSVFSAASSIVTSTGGPREGPVDALSQGLQGNMPIIAGVTGTVRRGRSGWSVAAGRVATQPDECAVTVAVRVRPFSVGEKLAEARRIMSADKSRMVVANPSAFADPDALLSSALAGAVPLQLKDSHHTHLFDHCLWSYDPTDAKDEYCDQAGVFDALGRRMLTQVERGKSVSCFAYGQTGSGKTHSLFGSICETQPPAAVEGSSQLGEEQGLLPRVFAGMLEAHKRSYAHDTTVLLSFLEIYNDKMRDLLAGEQDPPATVDSLRARDHPNRGTYVEGLIRRPVKDIGELMHLLQEGHTRRASSWSGWVPTANKSHVVATLELVPTAQLRAELTERRAAVQLAGSAQVVGAPSLPADYVWQSVKVQMCELAGSEVFETATAGETKLIGRSLAAVGTLVSAMARGESAPKLAFRDSTLTWLMRDCLNPASAHCALLATLSPAHTCFDESSKTLNYAERACHIRTRQFRFGEAKVPLTSTSSSAATSSSLTARPKATRSPSAGPMPAFSTSERHPTPSSARKRPAPLKRTPQRGEAEAKSSSAIPSTPSTPSSTRREPPGGEGFDSEMALIFADELRKNYQMLAAQHSGLQRELEDIRTDRDSMLEELHQLYDNGDGPLAEERERRSETEKALMDLQGRTQMLERWVCNLFA